MRPLALLLVGSMGCATAEPAPSTSADEPTGGEQWTAAADATSSADAGTAADGAPNGEHSVATLRFDGVEDGVISTVAAIGDALCVDGEFTRVATSSGDSPTYVPRNGAAWLDPRTGQLLP